MSEHQHQAALIRWANASLGLYPELRWLFAVPNAAKRGVKLAAMMKASGLKAGVPDLLLPVARNGFIGMAIEMKFGKNKLTAAQQEWAEGLKSLGWRYVVCYDWEKGREALKDYLSSKEW
jgi:hypothetical protein